MKKISNLTTIGTFALTIVGFGLIATLAYFTVNRLQESHLQNDKMLVLEIAKKAVILPLWNYDEVYIHEVLRSFIDERLDTVIAVKIVTFDEGRSYGKKSKKFRHLNYSDIASLEKVEVLRDNIVYRGRTLGTIEVYFSTALFTSAFARIGTNVLIMTFLLACLLAFTMNYFLRHWLIKPLNEIAQDARKALKGDYNINFRTNYFGELNVVTQAFNDTLSALLGRDKLLLEQNLKLEELIERRTSELDLERLKNFQASRLASLGEMAGAIAHEINNPLTIIHGFSKSLQTSLTNINEPDLALKSRKIYETSERIAKIVRGLRSFARDGSHDPLQLCSVVKFVEDLSSLCQSRAIEKEIELKFDYKADDEILINITQLGQVLINLINNAMDAVENNEQKWIKVKIQKSINETIISVTDSGAGISKEIIPKIMDPFFTTKDFGKGTGLGLSVSQRIITQHGGDIYYNHLSQNTQFVIHLPKSGITLQ